MSPPESLVIGNGGHGAQPDRRSTGPRLKDGWMRSDKVAVPCRPEWNAETCLLFQEASQSGL